jgi:arsenate reductase (thioredoxin)
MTKGYGATTLTPKQPEGEFPSRRGLPGRGAAKIRLMSEIEVEGTDLVVEIDDPLLAAPLELQPFIKHGERMLCEEFAGVFGAETIHRFLCESWGAFPNAKVRDFIPLFMQRFTRQRLRALARIEGLVSADTPMVVFLCIHNAGRSQMAAGWLKHLAGDDVEVFSGGSDPASEINPAAVEAMAEIGIDISQEFPKPWTDEVVRAAGVIVTMGCGDACPLYPGKRYLDWQVPDPAGLPVEQVRPIRDEIGRLAQALYEELVPAPA